jgi:ABC-type dipeptide/oligopeptide/nickel transport system permease subunit
MRGARRSLAFLSGSPSARVASILLGGVIILAIVGPFLAGGPEHQDILVAYSGPSATHLLGTDQLGRDVLARLATGARISLLVALISTILALTVGLTVGSIAGYFGGIADNVMMRFVDAMYAVPDFLFAILLSALIKSNLAVPQAGMLGIAVTAYRATGGLLGIFLTIGLTAWLTTSRIVRGQFLYLKHAGYVDAARLAGVSSARIVWHHLLPNAGAAILVAATLTVPSAILLEAALSFIGLGVDPPTPSWGTMMSQGVAALESYPYLLLFPALAIGITLWCLNVLGDSLRDQLDPRLSRR